MSAQLDILALEPFYGGERRAFLEALIHGSRHRWTLLKLPPRRLERRMAAAGLWFAEQLSRQSAGAVDLLFTSDSMNLGDLFSRVTSLSRKPSVVYFHANQLPPPESVVDGPHDLVYLSSANAASEIWFNSHFHFTSFFTRLGGLFERHPDLGSSGTIATLRDKSKLILPPVAAQPTDAPVTRGDSRTVFINLHGAPMELLNQTLLKLRQMNEEFQLLVVGPAGELDASLPRRIVSEQDEAAQQAAAAEAGTYLSILHDCPQDHHLIRCLSGGAWPVVPARGVYPELIPKSLHRPCMHDGSMKVLIERLQDAWQFRPEAPQQEALRQIPHQFDPLARCREIDQRLEEVALENMLMT
jgi:hypothetical protein